MRGWGGGTWGQKVPSDDATAITLGKAGKSHQGRVRLPQTGQGAGRALGTVPRAAKGMWLHPTAPRDGAGRAGAAGTSPGTEVGETT